MRFVHRGSSRLIAAHGGPPEIPTCFYDGAGVHASTPAHGPRTVQCPRLPVVFPSLFAPFLVWPSSFAPLPSSFRLFPPSSPSLGLIPSLVPRVRRCSRWYLRCPPFHPSVLHSVLRRLVSFVASLRGFRFNQRYPTAVVCSSFGPS